MASMAKVACAMFQRQGMHGICGIRDVHAMDDMLQPCKKVVTTGIARLNSSYLHFMRRGIAFESNSRIFSTPTTASSNEDSREPSSQVVQEEDRTSRQTRRKRRLDDICRERFPQHTAGAINSWILQGKVLVEGQPVLKPGTALYETAKIDLIAEVPRYVCRAGLKLEAALSHFKVDVMGAVVLDAGISTGGFTDCVLQHGAAHVYGVDVGYGQVSERIRTDPRVTIYERTNLRYLEGLPQQVDLVMPAVCRVLKAQGRMVALIKPQFEARKDQVGDGGVVRDPQVHDGVLTRVISGVEGMGFHCRGWIPSPIKGAEGNTEFLASFERKIPNMSM